MEISSDCSGHAVEKHMERDLPRKCGGDDMEDESAAAQFADDCFNCNICLDFVVEPVVTLCGHLYCWPCIYRWLQVDSPAVRQCPVCKAPLSLRTLVPLYGRGDVRSSAKGTEPEIPRRSSLPHHAMIDSILAPRSSPGANQERRDAHLIHELVRPLALLHHQHADYYTGYVPASPIFRSTAGGVLGDLATFILPWASRGGHDHEASMLQAGPRVAGRRQLQMESCLNQLWLFLFCCVLLCLLFF